MNYHPIPQPDEVTIREREDGMGAYLMMFASVAAGLPLPIINLIASVIYYYINQSKSRFVRFHSLHSLYAQFPTSIINAIGVFWFLRIYVFHSFEMSNNFKGYIIMAVCANLLYFIFSIVAAVRARKGRFYYFLFFGQLAYRQVYAVKEGEDEGGMKKAVNQPPIS